ncbi:MAG: hypothetical protein HQK52_23125 [Oligoflexia bacterium]|nr:hypothetical protein [Oligoflexia bacterium]
MAKFSLTKVDPNKLSNEITDFGPEACMECDFSGIIPIDYFQVKPEINNEKEYNEVKALVKEKLGFETFSEISSDLGGLISVCKCPKCGSEEIFQDF